jgi:hypothetical protein
VAWQTPGREDDRMRRVVIIILIAFVAYFLVTDTTTLADVLTGIGSFFGQVFEAIIDLFAAIFS